MNDDPSREHINGPEGAALLLFLTVDADQAGRMYDLLQQVRAESMVRTLIDRVKKLSLHADWLWRYFDHRASVGRSHDDAIWRIRGELMDMLRYDFDEEQISTLVRGLEGSLGILRKQEEPAPPSEP